MNIPDLAEFESAYRSRLQAGLSRWHPGAYEDFEMRPFLEAMIGCLGCPMAGLQILDLGCGTGQISTFFAGQGGFVTGADISPAAIVFAHQQAQVHNLAINYLVGDVRTLSLPLTSFDLIIDCGFLHCVVSPPDRDTILSHLAAWLKPCGELWSETMIGIPRMREGEDYFLDDSGVFWKTLGGGIRYPQSIEREGKFFSPIRRIWPEVGLFNQELERHGFQIIYQEQEKPLDEYSVWMIRTRAIMNQLY